MKYIRSISLTSLIFLRMVSPSFGQDLSDLKTNGFENLETFQNTTSSDPTEEVVLIDSLTSINSSTLSLSLGDWRVIQSISLDVEAIGSDARLEVLVNGNTKASLFIPGHDPHYFVTIADAARSIEIKRTSGGQINVLRLVATLQKRADTSFPNPGNLTSRAAQIGIDVIRNSNDFLGLISLQDFNASISPVKIRAGRVYAKATASGDNDTALNTLMTELLRQMQGQSSFIDRCLGIDSLFKVGTKFLENQYRLDELLH